MSKFHVFQFYEGKSFFLQKMVGVRGGGLASPAPLPFLYGPGSAWDTLFSYYSVAIYAYSEPYLGRFRYFWNFGLFRNVMFHTYAAIFRTFEYVIRHCFMQNKKFQTWNQNCLVCVILGFKFKKLLSCLKLASSNFS